MEKRLLSAEELGEYIGKSREAVYQMVSRRQIPFVKVGKRTMFDLLRIDAWIQQHTVNPTDHKIREA